MGNSSEPLSPQSIDYQGVSIAKAMLILFCDQPDECLHSGGLGAKQNSGLPAA